MLRTCFWGLFKENFTWWHHMMLNWNWMALWVVIDRLICVARWGNSENRFSTCDPGNANNLGNVSRLNASLSHVWFFLLQPLIRVPRATKDNVTDQRDHGSVCRCILSGNSSRIHEEVWFCAKDVYQMPENGKFHNFLGKLVCRSDHFKETRKSHILLRWFNHIIYCVNWMCPHLMVQNHNKLWWSNADPMNDQLI